MSALHWRYCLTIVFLRFAGVLASEQSDNEFLEPAELGGRRTAIEKLDEEKRNYEEQLARSVSSIVANVSQSKHIHYLIWCTWLSIPFHVYTCVVLQGDRDRLKRLGIWIQN